MASGIYAIVNTTNSKMYVGSAVDLDQRKSSHFSRLRNNVHPSKHLQAAFLKYGEQAFIFRVLEEVGNPTDLIVREQHWIDTLCPKYNKRTRAESNQGMVFTKAHRTEISKSAQARAATSDGASHIAALAERTKALWADPAHREARIEAIRAAWTPEKRQLSAVSARARATHIVDGVHFGTHRVWTDEEKARAGAKQKANWSTRAPVSENDIRALVTSTNPAWSVRELTGVRSMDKVLIYCETHDHAQWQTVAKVRHAHRGCKLCGYQRSSDVQSGRLKSDLKPLVS